MCGIAGIFGECVDRGMLRRMTEALRHRGPDAHGVYFDPSGRAGLGHNRLSIIDLSSAGRQPMCDASGRYWIAFNGEVYNYRELRAELHDYPFRTFTDTEVILAAWDRWGEGALDRLLGMFAFVLWDEKDQRLVGVRDRFGVKPFFYAEPSPNSLAVGSEISAFHSIQIGCSPDERAWATYFTYGLHDHSETTFWKGILSLAPGHLLDWKSGNLQIRCWYDLAQRVDPNLDTRAEARVCEEYEDLLDQSVRLRFRSDVKVGIAVSGGLDSSTLVGLVHQTHSDDSAVQAFTYICGDSRYDELPWVRTTLQRTGHPLVIVRMTPASVPELAASVQRHECEPFGGLPTLAYAMIFESAREMGCIVLLDGQGMDEQWAGYDYYERALDDPATGPVQGSKRPSLRPDCLRPEFRAKAQALMPAAPFPDALRNLQYRDIRYTKIPRALRFNDRISMRSSTELREPFLDHRLFELALRQPAERKIAHGQRKYLLRKITRKLLPCRVTEAPKRPVQTPQREWLAGPLKSWATDHLDLALRHYGEEWLDPSEIRGAWSEYLAGDLDNSFYVWQWISLGLMRAQARTSIGNYPALRMDEREAGVPASAAPQSH